MNYPNEKRSSGLSYTRVLFVSWSVAILVSAIYALALYFNPDWRQSDIDVAVEESEEDGKVKRQVKVERPEPDEDQVREIARNQERKKRRDLKREIKKIVEVVRETEAIKRERKRELASRTVDDEAFRLAIEIESVADKLRNSFENDPYMGAYETPDRGSKRTLEIATELADQARADTDGVLTADEAAKQVTIAETLVETSGVLVDAFERGRRRLADQAEENGERNRIRKALRGNVRQANELRDKSEEYLAFIRDIMEERLAETEAKIPPEALSEDPPERAQSEEMLDDYDEAALEEMTTYELYEAAQDLGETVNENFTEARAAELAAMESSSFEEALDDTYKPAMPEAPDLSEILGPEAQPPGNSEAFETYNAALEQAVRSAQDIAKKAASRASQIAGSKASKGEERSGRELSQMLRARTSVQTAMASKASMKGRQQGAVADMTALMAQAYGMSGDSGGMRLGDEGQRDALLNRGAYRGSMGRSDSPEQNVLQGLSTRDIVAQALPGRKFSEASDRKGWLFVDTWYIIGPWQRPRHAATSFEKKKFPPETLVDFDATYSGKAHPVTDEPLRLKWRFIQTDRIRINPPDEINDATYYAYTEVHSDRPRKVMLAVGSDDYAKIWINDLVVWEEKGLSSWSMDQGFRKVLLKAGYNEILVRLESGPGVAFFSLMLIPDRAEAAR